MSFKKKFFKNLLVSGAFSYLSQGIAFFSSVIVSRLLSPESYGFVGIITIFTGFLSIFSDSGISLAIIRSEYSYTYHKAVDTLAILIGISLFIVTSILSYPISLFFKNTALTIPMIVMSLSYITRSMTLVRSAILSKKMEFGYLGFVNLMSTIFTVAVTIVLAYLGYGFWSLIVPQIASSILSLILLENKVKFKFHLYSFSYVKVSFKYTKKILSNVMGFNIVNYWSRNFDNLLVGRMYGTGDLGIYNRAYNLLTIPLTLITGLVGTVLYPSLNKVKDDMDLLRTEYLFILKVIRIAAFPIACLLILGGDHLVIFLWGPKWVQVASLLPYFGLLFLSQSLLSTIGNILVLVRREETLKYSGWISAVAIIIGIIWGARISLEAIAQFYSLAFILFVLPYHLWWVYVKVIGYSLKRMLLFWGVNIAFSIGLWLACIYNMSILKMIFLSGFLVTIIIDSIPELKLLRGLKKK